MPGKDFELGDGLTVTVYKRKTNRHVRLSVTPLGQVRVSIPAWAPYRAGLSFAQSREQWIRDLHSPAPILGQGQAVGKAHHLVFVEQPGIKRPTGRIRKTEVLIRFPAGMTPESSEVQAAAQKACLRALRQQAEQLLPLRLAALAKRHSFTYRNVGIKRLKGRWGSCDQDKNIVLNVFLMQLPWELIDYVILHELTHTKVLRHGPPFWQEMSLHLPNVKELKKRLRGFHPVMTNGAPAIEPG